MRATLSAHRGALQKGRRGQPTRAATRVVPSSPPVQPRTVTLAQTVSHSLLPAAETRQAGLPYAGSAPQRPKQGLLPPAPSSTAHKCSCRWAERRKRRRKCRQRHSPCRYSRSRCSWETQRSRRGQRSETRDSWDSGSHESAVGGRVWRWGGRDWWSRRNCLRTPSGAACVRETVLRSRNCLWQCLPPEFLFFYCNLHFITRLITGISTTRSR